MMYLPYKRLFFLERLPGALGNLKRLETLHLQCNLMSSVPDNVLASLTALKTLDLSHNRLQSFPPSLCSLKHLDFLNLSHNQLHSLPEDNLNQLSALELNLSSNSLPRLPVALSMCKRLKVLRVEENCLELSGVPQEILADSKVSLLCLDGNLFQQKDLQQVPGYAQVWKQTCGVSVWVHGVIGIAALTIYTLILGIHSLPVYVIVEPPLKDRDNLPTNDTPFWTLYHSNSSFYRW